MLELDYKLEELLDFGLDAREIKDISIDVEILNFLKGV